MIISNTFFLFLFVNIISIGYSQQTTSVSESRIGVSGCYVKGGYAEYCYDKFAQISHFPKDCSSYFLDSIVVDIDRDVNGVFGKSTTAVLNELVDTGKPVYAVYGFVDIYDFFCTLESDPSDQTNITKEMDNLQNYLSQFTTLAGLLVAIDFSSAPSLPTDFSKKLKSYLQILKKSLPNNMEVGLCLPVYYFRDSVDRNIEFKVLNEVTDFYVPYVYALNDDCSPGLISGGQSPVDGGANYTLESLQSILIDAGVPKHKLQYLIITFPTDNVDCDICDVNYYEMCKHPDLATDWCADTLESYYDKGKFVRKNANGFISGYIDLDDPRCDCKCNHPFPAFYSILNGFHGGPLPDKCPLFDRT